jgi:hypothetical protein
VVGAQPTRIKSAATSANAPVRHIVPWNPEYALIAISTIAHVLYPPLPLSSSTVECSEDTTEYTIAYAFGQRFSTSFAGRFKLFDSDTATLEECKAMCDALKECRGIYLSCSPCTPTASVTQCRGISSLGGDPRKDNSPWTQSLVKVVRAGLTTRAD